MTRPARAAFRGEVTAAAFLIDRLTIGETEARQRVLARWTAGTRLLRWPDGRWLLVLGRPETVLAERAPGLPLVGGPTGLATPCEPVTPGSVRVPRGDTTVSVPLADLAAVDVSGWLARADLAPVALLPVEGAMVVTEPDPPPAVDDDPDLRSLAGVGEPSRRVRALADGAGSLPRRVVLALVALVVVAGLVAAGVALFAGGDATPPPAAPQTVAVVPTPTPADPSAAVPSAGPTEVRTPPPTVRALEAPATSSGAPSWLGLIWPLGFLAVAIVVAAVRARRGSRPGAAAGDAARSGPGRAPRPRRWREAVTRRVLGTPAGGVIGRRHARYLDRLAQDLERGRWDDALPAAIGLGGGTGVLSLRLPRRRESLSPLGGGAGARTFPWGATVEQHLRELYVRAAERLETEGSVERAAFVHAVLLRDPAAAVALLERSGDPALAARIAEARHLDPALVVRLWWQAGDRDRAVAVARARGAFAAAVVRLERVDPALARELRAEWIRSARTAGDHVTAVDAAWPDPELRRASLADLRAGLEAGGPAAGRLLARFLAGDWDTRPLAGVALDLASAAAPAEVALRSGFLTAFADLPAADRPLDRRLASAAALATLRAPTALAGLPAREATAVVSALRRRADPLLAADLPPWAPPAVPTGPIEVDLGGPPGLVALYDAVVLADGSVLTALGELGLRWLTAAGHVRAQWSLPVHALVVADHGGSALLVRDAGELTEFHRLDLGDRRVRPWTTLRTRGFAGSFDGTTLVTAVDDGIAVVDTVAARPRVVWSELSADQPLLALTRTARRLGAVAVAPPPSPTSAHGSATPAARGFELFDWDLPSMTLRLRRRIDPPAEFSGALVLPGCAVLLGHERRGAALFRGWAPPRLESLPPGHRLAVDADALLSVGPDGRDGFVGAVTVEHREPVAVRGPGSPDHVAVHVHGDVVTVLDTHGGRAVGVDLARREIVTRVRTDL